MPWGHADGRNSPPFRLGIQTQVEGERELARLMELPVQKGHEQPLSNSVYVFSTDG